MLAMQLVPCICAPALYAFMYIVFSYPNSVNHMDVHHPAYNLEVAHMTWQDPYLCEL